MRKCSVAALVTHVQYNDRNARHYIEQEHELQPVSWVELKDEIKHLQHSDLAMIHMSHYNYNRWSRL